MTTSNTLASLQALSFQQHGALRWRGPADYSFARHDQLSPLVLQELPQATMALPIGFAAEGEHFVPVAVQGLQPGTNLLVAPDGRWLAGYIPSACRSYPFQLAQDTEGQKVLCLHTGSGLFSTTEGNPLFTPEGQPSESITQLLQFFQQREASRQHTAAACAVLQQHQLIQPWPLQIQTDTGTQALNGLFRVDEAALKQLDGTALHTLQGCGALQLAYCQLLSMQHMAQLGTLAAQRAEATAAAAPPSPAADLDLEFLNHGGTLNFSGL